MRAKLVLSHGRYLTGNEWMNEANGSLTSIAIKNLPKHFVLSGERHALPLSLVLNNCVCLDVSISESQPTGVQILPIFLWIFILMKLKKKREFLLSCRTNYSVTPVLSLHSWLHILSALFSCLTLRNISPTPFGMLGVLCFSASPDVIL